MTRLPTIPSRVLPRDLGAGGGGCGIMVAMEPYAFEVILVRRLLAWGLASAAGGTVLAATGWLTGNRLLRAFGSQTIGWGAIDGGLALAGRARATRLLEDPPGDPAAPLREAARARRILAVNAGLDAIYVAIGLAVVAVRGRRDPGARGHGLATVVQGAFLLVFDAWHAARLPVPLPGAPGRDATASDLQASRPSPER
jgi:hypothetical protein